ncbi:hypothetical protein KR093_010923 [Drosophila rubida]|uniref:Uncharacterized protein n=1 Tax=Drosophila rubida TaxID=30044 RepID=A0AAD4PSX8_9MUSC|nr:hypothetical protein KR093_010923 [Drosophila rubida]
MTKTNDKKTVPKMKKKRASKDESPPRTPVRRPRASGSQNSGSKSQSRKSTKKTFKSRGTQSGNLYSPTEAFCLFLDSLTTKRQVRFMLFVALHAALGYLIYLYN